MAIYRRFLGWLLDRFQPHAWIPYIISLTLQYSLNQEDSLVHSSLNNGSKEVENTPGWLLLWTIEEPIVSKEWLVLCMELVLLRFQFHCSARVCRVAECSAFPFSWQMPRKATERPSENWNNRLSVQKLSGTAFPFQRLIGLYWSTRSGTRSFPSHRSFPFVVVRLNLGLNATGKSVQFPPRAPLFELHVSDRLLGLELLKVGHAVFDFQESRKTMSILIMLGE